ncbi:MAG TPA: C39 family peptidase [Candidatus Angelobacter sp.]|nr:C39 family peptidase [Candidatus Angelobacter sp.]
MVRNMPQRPKTLPRLCGFVLAATLFAINIFAATPGVWLDVPFIKQEKDGCGPASIAMVMQYWLKQKARPVDASADVSIIQHTLVSEKEHGTRASAMEQYFQQHGFQTFVFAGKWDDLKQHLDKGRPLIVALKPSALETSLHYVVVVGVDPEQGIVYLNDAAERKLLKQERSTFEKQWSAVKRWTLLALPK